MLIRGIAVPAAVGMALVALPAGASAVAPHGGHHALSKDNVIVASAARSAPAPLAEREVRA